MRKFHIKISLYTNQLNITNISKYDNHEALPILQNMTIQVVEFSRGGYKIGKIFA